MSYKSIRRQTIKMKNWKETWNSTSQEKISSLKRCPISLVIKKMQIKTTPGCYYTTTRMAKLKRQFPSIYLPEHGVTWSFLNSWCVLQSLYKLFGTIYENWNLYTQKPNNCTHVYIKQSEYISHKKAHSWKHSLLIMT